jgi:hypothetical protein
MPTDKEKITNFDTLNHIVKVRNYLNRMVAVLLDRGEKHDQSKMEAPELELFVEYTDKLAETTYGSEEYEANKKAMAPAIEHHYAHNRHHPEHHKNGIDDMNLVDLIEMFCDWKAASERHNDGNIRKSIEVNGRRFDMSPQLIRIFENSVDLL